MRSAIRSAALFVVIAVGTQMPIRAEGAGAVARARIADTPIRAEANSASPIVATLHEGDPVDVVDSKDGWYRVLLPGDEAKPQVGYVLMRLIDVISADESAAQDPVTSPQVEPAARPSSTVQGAFIAPVPTPVQRRPNKAAQREQKLKAKAEALEARREQKLAEREQKLKAKVDARQAELDALTIAATNSRK